MYRNIKHVFIYFFVPYIVFLFFLKVVGIEKIFNMASIYNFLHFIIPSTLVILTLHRNSKGLNQCLKNSIYTGFLIAIVVVFLWYLVFNNYFFRLLDNSSLLVWGWGYLIPFFYYYKSCHSHLDEKKLTLFEKVLRTLWAFFLIVPPLVYVVYEKYYGAL